MTDNVNYTDSYITKKGLQVGLLLDILKKMKTLKLRMFQQNLDHFQ